MPRVEFLVNGIPIPKARPRLTRRGRAYTPARTLEYEARVAKAAAQYFTSPIDYPVKLTAFFVMPTRRRADLDNLLKSLMDGMIKTVYFDDSQVTELKAGKGYNKGLGATTVVIEWVTE
jgi:crossover junction endodeoxyribonuclease RusA